MLKKVWRHKNMKESFLGALLGIKIVLRTERNAKVIIVCGIITILLSIFMKITWQEFIVVSLVIFGVFICEIFNTVIENILDFIHPLDNPHIKILKDISSATVLLACISALIVGIIIFVPKLIKIIL